MVLADSHRISRVLWYLGDWTGSQRAFAYRTVTCCGPTFQTVRLACWFLTPRPYGPPDPSTPPHASVLGFRLIPFRSPLLRESNFLSLPRGTEMSHFPPLASFRLLNSADDDANSLRPGDVRMGKPGGSHVPSSSAEFNRRNEANGGK